MLITVVTPSYNQGRFLAQTIESVLGQEGAFHLDYVIMDGGSTDASVQIIAHYEKLLQEGRWPVKCRGISYRWQSGKDRGQADAIARGFALGQGEILCWLNSDDTFLPGALAKACEGFLDEPRPAVVYGRSRFIDIEGATVGSYPTEPFDYRRLAAANFISQPSTFFAREAYLAVGGLDATLRYAMDFDLWIRMAAGRSFRYLPDFLSSYRLHEESKTVSPQDALANHREGLETVRRHFGWQPLNRVYGCCRARILALLPGLPPALAVLLAAPYTIVSYLGCNKGIRLEDVKMINRSNLRKLSKDWVEVHTGKAEELASPLQDKTAKPHGGAE